MIVTFSKPYGIIKGMLKKYNTIGLLSCNSCARLCETGGQAKMDNLAERLKKDGYEVVGSDLVPMVCNIDAVKRRDYAAKILLVLACDAGVFTEYGDVDSIVEGIEKAMSMPSGAASQRKRITENFTYEMRERELVKLINMVHSN